MTQKVRKAIFPVGGLGTRFLPAILILYYVEYVLQSKLADAFLLLYFVTGIVFLPGWIMLQERKKSEFRFLPTKF